MPNVCFEHEIIEAPMIFVVLLRCDDNLTLFLQHLIDMHSEKSKQFIRGPVVNRILGTKGKLNCLEHDYQE